MVEARLLFRQGHPAAASQTLEAAADRIDENTPPTLLGEYHRAQAIYLSLSGCAFCVKKHYKFVRLVI